LFFAADLAATAACYRDRTRTEQEDHDDEPVHYAARYATTPGAALRRYLEFRDRYCIMIGCQAPAHTADKDHTLDHARGGPTIGPNLRAACRHDHRLKGEGGWTLDQLQTGVFRWKSRLGHTYQHRPPAIIDHYPTPSPRPTPIPAPGPPGRRLERHQDLGRSTPEPEPDPPPEPDPHADIPPFSSPSTEPGTTPTGGAEQVSGMVPSAVLQRRAKAHPPAHPGAAQRSHRRQGSARHATHPGAFSLVRQHVDEPLWGLGYHLRGAVSSTGRAKDF
jgi:hypothetical protein